MNYFVAQFGAEETKLVIIDKHKKVIDSSSATLDDNNYVKQLADSLIELAHKNDLYHDDLNGIGLIINDIKQINYFDNKTLINDLESTFNFKAILEDNYDALIDNIVK
ncbi:hypothetical protein [Staphylococcus kloosii]|jgi:predicted NBD/HSP70 family sugar kinase|uniref:Uncharacterized protein n=1 Tax=Staphylococcus kloosii TaxID=29384 RepID=A0A151A2E1_9STAP|nr:hypothetical protein [Staphylococcus kloosii]KYH13598.1 hypothetical protein A0131_02080 [Staphylococcus kloosii]MBF7021090.1 hypothetical protein [Staphylococcus kloosii]MCD8879625.1 hypothetical protein [Staphylococcus kloosii]HJF66722.1 hypothetical protein [Staphylococcus kloosii]